MAKKITLLKFAEFLNKHIEQMKNDLKFDLEELDHEYAIKKEKIYDKHGERLGETIPRKFMNVDLPSDLLSVLKQFSGHGRILIHGKTSDIQFFEGKNKRWFITLYELNKSKFESPEEFYKNALKNLILQYKALVEFSLLNKEKQLKLIESG